MNNHHYFWGGPFSQWAKSSFTIDGQTFNCAEQYMMYKKAMLFNDTDIAEKILSTSNPREQKALGRQVKGFDPDVWYQHAEQYVYDANVAKFTQNPEFLQSLADTGNDLIVEASPYDDIWGIGLDSEAASVTPPEQWPGKNLLGKVLMRVREDILSNRLTTEG